MVDRVSSGSENEEMGSSSQGEHHEAEHAEECKNEADDDDDEDSETAAELAAVRTDRLRKSSEPILVRTLSMSLEHNTSP